MVRLNSEVIGITRFSVTKGDNRENQVMFLLVALVLPWPRPGRQGAPSPLVVCHVDQAPQMLVPAYLANGMAASTMILHPVLSPRGDALTLGDAIPLPRSPSPPSNPSLPPRDCHLADTTPWMSSACAHLRSTPVALTFLNR